MDHVQGPRLSQCVFRHSCSLHAFVCLLYQFPVEGSKVSWESTAAVSEAQCELALTLLTCFPRSLLPPISCICHLHSETTVLLLIRVCPIFMLPALVLCASHACSDTSSLESETCALAWLQPRASCVLGRSAFLCEAHTHRCRHATPHCLNSVYSRYSALEL